MPFIAGLLLGLLASAARITTPPNIPSSLAPDSKASADAANEAAKEAATIWIFFLSFMVYLAVAVGATTHRVLFLESPVKLPIFGVDLPLIGFYVIAPILFIVLHFYCLVQLRTLANRINALFDEVGMVGL